MKTVRIVALAILILVAVAVICADFLAPAGYSAQFREMPNAAPSRAHLLGTDELGRDQFSRLLHGTRVSLLLAPAAALLSTLIAGIIGGFAGFAGGITQRIVLCGIDLVLSLPWLFLLITVRALMPLNVPPLASVIVTFGILGLLGWAAAARVVCAGIAKLRDADFMLAARAAGIPPYRQLFVHLVPNLLPVLAAQFWIAVPAFILAEANLGVLGLGVAEPLPSWGGLLRQLEGVLSVGSEAWKFVPLVLLIVVVTSFEMLMSSEEVA